MNDSRKIIVPYKPIWTVEFESEKKLLQEIFGSSALEIEHIGSTSIQGLTSKPIIDIVVMISEPSDADKFTEALSKLGYILGPSSTERKYYLKELPNKIHLSIAFADQGGFWYRQILFRDYLRKHEVIKKEYEKIKLELLEHDPLGAESYIQGKTDFVYHVLQLAGWKEGQKYNDG